MAQRKRASINLGGILGAAMSGIPSSQDGTQGAQAGATQEGPNQGSGEGALSVIPGSTQSNISPPGFWERAFNPNANAGYRAGQFELQNTGLSNQGKLANTQAEGSNTIKALQTAGQETRTTAQQSADIATQKLYTDMALKYASENNIPVTSSDDLDLIKNKLQSGAIDIKAGQQGQTLNAIKDPNTQPNVTAGYQAQAFGPAAMNMDRTRTVLNPGQNFQSMASLGIGDTGIGATQEGTQNAGSSGFDSTTGKMQNNSQAINKFAGGGFNSNMGVGSSAPSAPPIPSSNGGKIIANINPNAAQPKQQPTQLNMPPTSSNNPIVPPGLQNGILGQIDPNNIPALMKLLGVGGQAPEY